LVSVRSMPSRLSVSRTIATPGRPACRSIALSSAARS
jgi:hypothetical protein